MQAVAAVMAGRGCRCLLTLLLLPMVAVAVGAALALMAYFDVPATPFGLSRLLRPDRPGGLTLQAAARGSGVAAFRAHAVHATGHGRSRYQPRATCSSLHRPHMHRCPLHAEAVVLAVRQPMVARWADLRIAFSHEPVAYSEVFIGAWEQHASVLGQWTATQIGTRKLDMLNLVPTLPNLGMVNSTQRGTCRPLH